MSAASVSVVIPTRDRPGPLARCLAALGAEQGIELDVVVVDDGSRDPEAVRRVVGAHERARLLRLDGRGPAAARNAGIREASGEIVLMTDDDCIASPGWAAALAREIADSGALAVGRTLYDARRALVAASETIVSHAERRESFGATRNVGLRRDVALATPFDERFREAGGEDREWCRRLARGGTPVVHVGEAVVSHDPELDLARFWRQHLRYGRAARIDRGRASPALGAYRELFAAGFRAGLLTGLLVVLAQVPTALGYVSGRE